MVKVLIDGKEHEGIPYWEKGMVLKHIFVWTKDKSPAQEFREVMSKKEPEFVSVPKEIKFIGLDLFPETIRGLFVNKHTLRWSGVSWEFNSDGNYEKERLNCVLVPCKREDLDDGDWALNWFPLAKTKIEELLNNTSNYCLIIGKEKEVRMNEDGTNIWVTDTFSGNEWFKVVPKNDL